MIVTDFFKDLREMYLNQIIKILHLRKKDLLKKIRNCSLPCMRSSMKFVIYFEIIDLKYGLQMYKQIYLGNFGRMMFKKKKN